MNPSMVSLHAESALDWQKRDRFFGCPDQQQVVVKEAQGTRYTMPPVGTAKKSLNTMPGKISP